MWPADVSMFYKLRSRGIAVHHVAQARFLLIVFSVLTIIIQNSPLVHHKLPVNLVVWSCGNVRALRAAGSGFDPRARHSLDSSG